MWAHPQQPVAVEHAQRAEAVAVADVQAEGVEVVLGGVAVAGRKTLTPAMRLAFLWRLRGPHRQHHRLDAAASARARNHQAATSIVMRSLTVMTPMSPLRMAVAAELRHHWRTKPVASAEALLL